MVRGVGRKGQSGGRGNHRPVGTRLSIMEQAVALYDYVAQQEDELSFKVGAVIRVVEKDESGWWKVCSMWQRSNGKVGTLITNYSVLFPI